MKREWDGEIETKIGRVPTSWYCYDCDMMLKSKFKFKNVEFKKRLKTLRNTKVQTTARFRLSELNLKKGSTVTVEALIVIVWTLS